MNTEQANAAQTNSGRDEKGRFLAGNKGGPGNPFARKVASLRQALLASISEQDIQDVAGRLLALAKEGDVQAAKLLLTYTLGKPQPAPDPDRMDADEWQVYQETTAMKKESAAVINAGAPEFHLNVVRAIRPVVTALMQQQINETLNEAPEQRRAREAAQAAECERILNTPPPPLPDDLAGAMAPSPNGAYGAPSPSPNGRNGTPSPSPNGKKPSFNGRDRCGPSPNGDFRFAGGLADHG